MQHAWNCAPTAEQVPGHLALLGWNSVLSVTRLDGVEQEVEFRVERRVAAPGSAVLERFVQVREGVGFKRRVAARA